MTASFYKYCLGSAIQPLTMLAATVAGLARYIRASVEPIRPGKLRLVLVMQTSQGMREFMESLELMPVRVRITSILKKAIFSGEYHSGDELSLTEVAARLGVSRTPVREAFQALAAEGLITLRMNKGAVVNTIDRKFIRDNFEMRILLEAEAAARAAANGMDISELLERLYEMRDHFDMMEQRDYETLNQDIHMGIWTAADNQKLKHYLMELWNGPSTGHSIREDSLHYKNSTFEHISILHFIRDRQSEQARRAMVQHISRSMDNILKNFPA